MDGYANAAALDAEQAADLPPNWYVGLDCRKCGAMAEAATCFLGTPAECVRRSPASYEAAVINASRLARLAAEDAPTCSPVAAPRLFDWDDAVQRGPHVHGAAVRVADPIAPVDMELNNMRMRLAFVAVYDLADELSAVKRTRYISDRLRAILTAVKAPDTRRQQTA